MSLPVALILGALVLVALALVVRWVQARASDARAERAAQQIFESARRQQAVIDADEPPKTRTEADTRAQLKLKHGGK